MVSHPDVHGLELRVVRVQYFQCWMAWITKPNSIISAGVTNGEGVGEFQNFPAVGGKSERREWERENE